jgi:hypothetical protein
VLFPLGIVLVVFGFGATYGAWTSAHAKSQPPQPWSIEDAREPHPSMVTVTGTPLDCRKMIFEEKHVFIPLGTSRHGFEVVAMLQANACAELAAAPLTGLLRSMSDGTRKELLGTEAKQGLLLDLEPQKEESAWTYVVFLIMAAGGVWCLVDGFRYRRLRRRSAG